MYLYFKCTHCIQTLLSVSNYLEGCTRVLLLWHAMGKSQYVLKWLRIGISLMCRIFTWLYYHSFFHVLLLTSNMNGQMLVISVDWTSYIYLHFLCQLFKCSPNIWYCLPLHFFFLIFYLRWLSLLGYSKFLLGDVSVTMCIYL